MSGANGATTDAAGAATIRAIVTDPADPARLVIRDVAAPLAESSEVLVRVAAVSLNRGETHFAMAATGATRPGWDFAGTIEAAAPDGTGPKLGSRVVGNLSASGGWAELVAAPVEAVAEIPEGVSWAQAATFPVAGLTALYALEKRGSLIGRRVLVTGASGGVGLWALQFAAVAGASVVVGAVRKDDHVALLKECGATEVVVLGDDPSRAASLGPFDVILESIGGASLAASITMLAPGGICVLFGATAASAATIDGVSLFRLGGASLYGFILFDEVKRHESAGSGLARIGALVAAGRVKPVISLEAPWTDIAAVGRRLIDGDFPGKAVLHLTDKDHV